MGLKPGFAEIVPLEIEVPVTQRRPSQMKKVFVAR